MNIIASMLSCINFSVKIFLILKNIIILQLKKKHRTQNMGEVSEESKKKNRGKFLFRKAVVK